MDTDKKKKKDDNPPPGEGRKKDLPDPKEEKDTTLAKRAGQRPALPFKRKPPA